MTKQAFEQGEWQKVVSAHLLESHYPAEWLRYGVALLQNDYPRAQRVLSHFFRLHDGDETARQP